MTMVATRPAIVPLRRFFGSRPAPGLASRPGPRAAFLPGPLLLSGPLLAGGEAGVPGRQIARIAARRVARVTVARVARAGPGAVAGPVAAVAARCPGSRIAFAAVSGWPGSALILHQRVKTTGLTVTWRAVTWRAVAGLVVFAWAVLARAVTGRPGPERITLAWLCCARSPFPAQVISPVVSMAGGRLLLRPGQPGRR